MKRTVSFILMLGVSLFYWSSCFPPSGQLPGEGTGEAEAFEKKFLDFKMDASGLVSFYCNDESKLGPQGYTYWCIGGYTWYPMTTFTVNICKISGSAAGAYGLVFAARDVDNFLTVFININRQYIIARVTDGDVLDLVRDWKTSNFLNPGYAGNRLRIEYDSQAAEYTIFFNADPAGITFADYADDPFTGGFCGFLAELHPSEDFPASPVEMTYELIEPEDIGFQQPQRKLRP